MTTIQKYRHIKENLLEKFPNIFLITSATTSNKGVDCCAICLYIRIACLSDKYRKLLTPNNNYRHIFANFLKEYIEFEFPKIDLDVKIEYLERT